MCMCVCVCVCVCARLGTLPRLASAGWARSAVRASPFFPQEACLYTLHVQGERHGNIVSSGSARKRRHCGETVAFRVGFVGGCAPRSSQYEAARGRRVSVPCQNPLCNHLHFTLFGMGVRERVSERTTACVGSTAAQTERSPFSVQTALSHPRAE